MRVGYLPDNHVHAIEFHVKKNTLLVMHLRLRIQFLAPHPIPPGMRLLPLIHLLLSFCHYSLGHGGDAVSFKIDEGLGSHRWTLGVEEIHRALDRRAECGTGVRGFWQVQLPRLRAGRLIPLRGQRRPALPFVGDGSLNKLVADQDTVSGEVAQAAQLIEPNQAVTRPEDFHACEAGAVIVSAVSLRRGMGVELFHLRQQRKGAVGSYSVPFHWLSSEAVTHVQRQLVKGFLAETQEHVHVLGQHPLLQLGRDPARLLILKMPRQSVRWPDREVILESESHDSITVCIARGDRPLGLQTEGTPRGKRGSGGRCRRAFHQLVTYLHAARKILIHDLEEAQVASMRFETVSAEPIKEVCAGARRSQGAQFLFSL